MQAAKQGRQLSGASRPLPFWAPNVRRGTHNVCFILFSTCYPYLISFTFPGFLFCLLFSSIQTFVSYTGLCLYLTLHKHIRCAVHSSYGFCEICLQAPMVSQIGVRTTCRSICCVVYSIPYACYSTCIMHCYTIFRISIFYNRYDWVIWLYIV